MIGLTIQTIGEVIIGLAVMRVHSRVVHEHKIDKAVIKTLKHERIISLVGILLIIAGFILQVTGN